MAALELPGNASSVHAQGRAIRALVDKARTSIAQTSGASREQVVFTGSATEAITQAIVGGAKAFRVDEIIVSAGEHAAVLKAAEMTGLPVVELPLLASGAIDLDALDAQLERLDKDGRRAIFALHWVNNETGVVQPLNILETRIGPTPHIMFVDAVQAFGKLPLEFGSRATDMMAISAHKIGGPAGVGVLLMKGHCDQVRLIPGGGQETGRRGGTEAHSLIAGFGAAAAEFPKAFREAALEQLIAHLEAELMRLSSQTVVFGEHRLGNVTDFAVPGIKAASAMMALDLDGIAVSSGSACSSGKVGKSHVLRAMGVPDDLTECALRVSLGWSSTKADIEAFLTAFEKIVARQARQNGQAA